MKLGLKLELNILTKLYDMSVVVKKMKFKFDLEIGQHDWAYIMQVIFGVIFS